MLQIFDKYYHEHTLPYLNLEPDPMCTDMMVKLEDSGAHHSLPPIPFPFPYT